jgi:phage-related protein
VVEWDIVFYETEDGDQPVREFLRGLTKSQRVEIGRSIRFLEEIGIGLREPDAKYLGDKLWELRTQVEGNTFRCIYFTWTNQRFVLLHAFQKKTQKTPPRELKTAQRRRDDWLERHQETP